MSEQKNPVAVITGASRGIGRASALALAKQGYDIGFCYHNAHHASKTLAQEITELDRRVSYLQCDVSDFDATSAFIEKIENDLGNIDVLVNNAGITQDSPLVMLDKDHWHQVIQTNLNSMYNMCSRVAFTMMKKRKGSIINMASVSGVYGNPGQSNYSASKAGIIGFTKSIAKELGKFNVRVNAIAPGFIQTDMTEDLPQSVIDRVMPNIPLQHVGSPEDVANAVVFLAQDTAKYITAQVIHVDGGVMI